MHEANELDGEANYENRVPNYQIWWVKKKAIFRREGLLEIVESNINPTTFLIYIAGATVTER